MSEVDRRGLRPVAIARAAGLALAAGAAAVGLSGCNIDSFFDQSMLGRWERTPTIMPVLDRIASIEDESGQYVETSGIRAEDLIPDAEEYRFGPGDRIEVRIRDFPQIGAEEPFDLFLDPRGYIDIRHMDPIRAAGKTTPELKMAIVDAMRDAHLQDNAIVSINVLGQRKQTFAVLGSAQSPGTYFIPAPDYRVLEGLTAAGGFNETVPYIYVIRQVALSDAAAGTAPQNGEKPVRPRPGQPKPGQKPNGDKLIDLIDELSQPKNKDEKPTPGMFGDTDGVGRRTRPGMRDQPPIDLPEPPPQPTDGAVPTEPGAAPAPKSDWVYVNGQWVKKAGSPGANGQDTGALVTQRVIEIPTAPLLAGAAEVNIVLRPGDVVRIPPAESGLVYMAGQVARPGPYNMPLEGKLTLRMAIISAGGLGTLGIPERVDLTRMVAPGRQAITMLNLRAIEEGTQPDIYLKPDDIINVGSNFWAYPAAVMRNGFRFSYGFGFILDRNFATDIFGPQSVNNN